MLWTIIGLLLLFWVIGLVFKVAGGLIHLLLVAAVIVFLFNFFKNRATR
ncbi:lmo0937 family membrane protein [Bacillus sp. FJAT-27245]|nr:lmo0937 family membrane protein [Bacillus sp. FJAT-27245]